MSTLEWQLAGSEGPHQTMTFFLAQAMVKLYCSCEVCISSTHTHTHTPFAFQEIDIQIIDYYYKSVQCYFSTRTDVTMFSVSMSLGLTMTGLRCQYIMYCQRQGGLQSSRGVQQLVDHTISQPKQLYRQQQNHHHIASKWRLMQIVSVLRMI